MHSYLKVLPCALTVKCTSFLRFSQWTAIISLNSSNWVVFVIKKQYFLCGRNWICKFNWDACVMTSAVSRWLLTPEPWVLFLDIPCKVCGGQKGTGNGSSAYASYFFCQYYSPVLHTHDLKTTIIRRASGRRLETFNQKNALPEIGKHWREKYFLTYFLRAWILYCQLEVGMHPEAPVREKRPNW